MTLPPAFPLTGTRRVPGDKSISHRAAILASVARGTSILRGFSPAGDCRATLRALIDLGVGAAREGDVVTIEGRGPEAFTPTLAPLQCGRSATTMRLMAGMVAGVRFPCTFTGDEQLLLRPMLRVAEPLRSMGAVVKLARGDRPPLTIRGGGLAGIRYLLPIPSAQVKSAVLLAGLQASGSTVVIEPIPVRDHTERLLQAMGAPVSRGVDRASWTRVERGTLRPLDLDVPGDFSSAAPLIVAAALVPGSDLEITGVGLNQTRTGLLDVLRRMGGSVEVELERTNPEPMGTIRVRSQPLSATTVRPEEVPGLIDELPLVGLLGAGADGVTSVSGAMELRRKESDRIAGLVAGLRTLGAEAEELPDGFLVSGPTVLGGGTCDARQDHRLVMAFSIAGLIATGKVKVEGAEFVDDSFPGFFEALDGSHA